MISQKSMIAGFSRGGGMEYYIKQIDKAKDIDELIEIVEEHAAFDDGITNKEYCEIVEYATPASSKFRLDARMAGCAAKICGSKSLVTISCHSATGRRRRSASGTEGTRGRTPA